MTTVVMTYLEDRLEEPKSRGRGRGRGRRQEPRLIVFGHRMAFGTNRDMAGYDDPHMIKYAVYLSGEAKAAFLRQKEERRLTEGSPVVIEVDGLGCWGAYPNCESGSASEAGAVHDAGLFKDILKPETFEGRSVRALEALAVKWRVAKLKR